MVGGAAPEVGRGEVVEATERGGRAGECDKVCAGVPEEFEGVEGLFAHGIAGEDEFTGAVVEDAEGEHSVEAVEDFVLPEEPALEDDLGVAVVGGEVCPGGLEFGAEGAVVVDAAVEDQAEGRVWVP